MAYDAACTLRMDGRAILWQGRAGAARADRRGSERVVISIKAVTSARADGGSLTLRFGRKTAVLDLGAHAKSS